MSVAEQAKSTTSIEAILRWHEHPDVMVRELFEVEPDPWQDEGLRALPHTPRMAMKAAKGPGKTAFLSWAGWWMLLTHPHPNIAATSISGDNLRDNLWKEMAHWRNKAPLLQRAFEWQTERIFNREHPATWFMSARSWPKSADEHQLGNTLAGLHSDYIMFLIDESGSIPPAITASAEAALSSCKAGYILQAGNTNSLDGALYNACVKHASMWKVIVITGDPDNPMRSPRINIEWARELIANYGRENPFVKVMVLGEWPSASVNALIGPDEVQAAMNRCYREFQYNSFAKVLGVDVARQGDAASVIMPRQGIIMFPPQVLRGVNSLQGAGTVARKWNEWQADACFIDATGGFGAGWVDQLSTLGKVAVGVQFAGEAHEPNRYYNKRTEMYFDLVDGIKNGLQLPPCPELMTALTQTLYTFKGDRMLLEPKEIVAKKIGYSPDHGDSAALTYAEPVSPRAAQAVAGNRQTRAMPEYDAFKQFFGDN